MANDRGKNKTIKVEQNKTSACLRVTLAIIQRHDKSKSGRKKFMVVTLPYHCSSSKEIRVGTFQGRDLDAQADAETMGCWRWYCSLPCCSVACSIFFKGGRMTRHQCWQHPHKSLIKKYPIVLLADMAWSYGGTISVEIASLQMTLAWVKLT